MFTITDAVWMAADMFPVPTAEDIAAIITDGVAEGYIPDLPYYHSLARIAGRLPVRTIRLIESRLWLDGDGYKSHAEGAHA